MSNKVPHSRDYIFTPVIRICHWLRALSIVLLVISGFYISWPFLVQYGGPDNLMQGWVRFGHLVAGFILVAITIIRAYLYFFSKSDIERRSFRDVISPKKWIENLMAYGYMGNMHKSGVYGPLQYMTYFALTMVIVVMCVTGLILHAHVYHEGLGGAFMPIAEALIPMFGTLAFVRELHHFLTWVFVIFMVIHVYMAVFSGIRFKHNSVDSIVSGYDYHPMKHK
ncbi:MULTISPECIES: Ni/Fe-hydrogenase, b-type cytochrome subunit [unclassified Ferrimonas]|uniref:Ni/Fe-hydrogenase, b-type cytochrome subunit n=1 Tax=unclassified Ferrimonas TaxID=2620587 RepID=UPI0025732AC8|nr:Ni/Fe-hydrogenase, b-type cytochrome subunit [Ferrimonas sp. YFM]BDY06328.1 Ni/Fe-hydrogenase, b-type cytochrome subunit [Ferrimonas sp. YFM]